MSKPRNIILPAGLVADRPDPADVVTGTLYPATDDGIIYRRKSDGTWENWDDFGGGGTTPTGTGFRHVTTGTEDGAAKLVEIADVASSLKPSGSAASTDESLRRLGTGSTHAAGGDDSRFPTTGEKNALAGTSGTPGSGNKYVTDGDARNTNARTPTAHKTSHEDGGSDEISIAGLAGTSVELAAHLADTTDAHDASAISSVAAGNLASTDVQAALNELDTEKAATASAVMDGDAAGGVLSGTYPNPGFAADMATQAELDAHTGDTSAAHAASAISADSTTLVGTGTDVQAVLEELDNGIADHLADTTDAHAGTAITNTPAGNIAATTVQAAINELDSEKAATASAVMDGDTAGGVLAGTYPNPTFASDMATQAELDTHASDTTSVHGITDTTLLALTTDPIEHEFPETPGTDTIATAKTRLTLRRVAFTSSERLTIEGTGRLMVIG